MRITLLDIKLLSIEEIRRVKNRGNGNWYWLRSPSRYKDYASCIDTFGFIYMHGNKINNTQRDGNDITIRPALIIKPIQIIDSDEIEDNEPLESFLLGEQEWINVFGDTYLCKEYIGKGYFDDKSNKYETSYINKYIHNWLSNLGFSLNTSYDLVDDEVINNDYIYSM